MLLILVGQSLERPGNMKLITITISLACLSAVVRADDLATPSPTPVYRHFGRPGSLRRLEQVNRQQALQSQADARAKAREQAKTNRGQMATAEAQARVAARGRERAQRQVETENRREAAKATPKTTSELMKQMGFSEEEVAAQKAREEPAKAGTKEPADTASQTKPAREK